MKNKKIFLNLLSSVGIYGGLLFINLFVSRFVLVGYGSEVNGFIASTNQIFSYVALLEAGIGTATISALYFPLSKADTEGINNVMVASRQYYRKTALWYFVCVVVISFLWPFVIETELSYFTICGYILFHGISSVISYCFTSTISNYFMASGKSYLNNYVLIAVTVVTYIAKIIISYLSLNIIYISISAIVINVFKCIFYVMYMKKHYPDYFKKTIVDMSLLKQRTSFLFHEISGVIFSSTDTIIISIFCSLSDASVYAVYSIVVNAINTIMSQALNSTYYILGNSYSKGKEGYVKTHDMFNSVFICIAFAIFTVAYILYLPFIGLYTAGVTDANYLDPNLPLLFVLIQLLSVCRMVDNYLIKIALHAKQTIMRSLAESAINLCVSLTLVNFIGIYGVLIGTVVALLYRTNDMILYVNSKILERLPLNEYKIYLINFMIFGVFVFLNSKFNFEVESYLGWVLLAIVVFIIVVLTFIIANVVINYKVFGEMLSKVKDKVQKKCH